jgi:RNA polymerase sigma-70 factor (ECF subfamily)
MLRSDQTDCPALSESKWFADDVRSHEPALRAYLLKRFPSLPDHDDVVQETYTRVLRAREHGRLTFARAFMFTAARNIAIDMFRRRPGGHEPHSDVSEMPILEEARGTLESIEHQQRLEFLLEAVSALPERCRQVMMLRHLDGLSYKEIAVQLGISPETVKVHVVKGLRDCVAFFRDRGLLEDGLASANGGADTP